MFSSRNEKFLCTFPPEFASTLSVSTFSREILLRLTASTDSLIFVFAFDLQACAA